MPTYKYEGENCKRHIVKGKVKAESTKDVREILREMGIKAFTIVEIKSILKKEFKVLESKRIKFKDFVIYLRQFSALLKAGISLADATNILAEQTSSRPLQKVLLAIEDDLQAGNPFSAAAEKHHKIFPALFINMAKAGEAGGNLDEILDRMASYYEKQNRTRQKVKSAMTYPIVIGVITLGITIFLLKFVVPTFAKMFASFDSELPMITQLVLAAGNMVEKYWWVGLITVIGLAFGFKAIRNNKKTKYYFDLFILRIPVFGTMLQKAALARLTRTMSSLFASSVPVLQAVAIVERIVGNEVIARVMRQSRTSLEKGESIAEPMKKHWAFPPLVTQMIAVGEKTGALDSMLDKVADFYEDEVEAATDQIKSMIEPMMVLVLAGVVGVIVASIAVPMFSIFEQIG